MRKFYFVLAAILIVASVNAQVITGNFSICLPGPTTTQLTASVPPAPITATTPWFSLNPAVATISSSGLVTGLNFGATTISYTDNLGSTYSVNVYVSTFPTIEAPNGTSICEAGTLQLEGSLFPNATNAWESLNTGIATVDSFGLVTGVAAGTVDILYRNLGGCTTTIPITVNPSLVPTITCGAITPTSITFNWNALPGASTYVRYSQLNGGPITSLGSDAPFTFTINDLSPEDQVTFYVVATGTSGNCFQAGQASCSTSPCPNAGTDGGITICETNTTTINLFSLITGEDLGGVWTRTSGTGGTFNSAAGVFTPNIGATTSTFSYTVLGSNPCPNDTSLATININQQPNAGIDGSTTICDSSFSTIDLYSLISGEQVGGTWTRVTGAGGIFDAIVGTYTPASGVTTSIFEYRVVGVAPCVDDFSIATININQQPEAGIDGCISVSDESPFIIDLYSLITGEQVGGTWTRTSGTGGTFNALAAIYVPAVGATTSTFEYLTLGTPPCIDDTSVATIVINGPPCGTLSSVDFQEETIEYFPNPISDVLNLKFSQVIKNIQIVNVLGQEVFSSDYNDKDLQINLSHLNSGTYIVKAMVTNSVRTFKIVKN
ncbi:MAG: Ig-like domain-containing protein [Flavobacterium sp.]|nr:Ig-like domain-containing protein [Flavobacterium sp.]